jgi:hypothetical protein
VLDADNPNQALVIRDAKTVETEGTKEKFERGKSKGKTVAISGRNLLGRITDYKGDFTIGNTMDPEVKKYVGRTNASYLKRTGQVGVIPSHYNGRVLTLTQLRKVISFNPTTGESDATINGGLRVPIIKRWFQGSKGEFGKTLQSINNDNLIKLTDLFDNTFVGVTPTTISLD